MTISVDLHGVDPGAARPAAEAFLHELSEASPEVTEVAKTDSTKIDPGTIIGIVTLVLSLPGVVLTGLQLQETLRRRRLAARVEALKANLEEFDIEATLNLSSGTALDLRRAQTDRIIEALPLSLATD